jgi:hypothetical protein
MNLMEVLQGHMSEDVLGQLGQQIGADKQQTASAANGIFASLLGGMAQNAQSPEGLQGLMGALDKNHDGSVLDDLMGMVSGSTQHANPATTNGLGILGHILGGKQEPVAQQVSQSSGLEMGQVMKLMPILAPILMGVLGKAKNTGGLGIGDLAGVLMGSTQGAAQMPGMGGILGVVLGNVMGGGQQQQGGGDLLGSILGNVLGGQQQQQQAPQQSGGGLFGQILGGILGKK